ncbi:hypothetical protein [Nostoc sp.]|uniref:hypothetical protein n=1 Tax=Nostoc sp. TaxID=1180 RepID=UPI002FF7578B
MRYGRSHASASNGSFNSNQRLDALVQAIRARQKFQRLDLQNLADANTLDLQTRKVLGDYLKTNITVEKSDRSLCNYRLFH